MRTSLTKYKAGSNNKAFSLLDVVIASILLSVMIGAVFEAFIFASKFYLASAAETSLLWETNLIIDHVLRGVYEAPGVIHLSEAHRYSISNISELHFWGADNIERSYRLDPTGTSIIFNHPPGGDEVVYTAPQGAWLTLRFWPPPPLAYSATDIYIDVGITQNIYGRNVTASAETMVNIRNH